MNTLYIVGPMHPYLFDGETPRMIPVEVEDGVIAYFAQIDALPPQNQIVLAVDDHDAIEALIHSLKQQNKWNKSYDANIYHFDFTIYPLDSPVIEQRHLDQYEQRLSA